MGELTWLQDKTIFYRYCFVQCLAQLSGSDTPAAAAIAKADRYAIAAADYVFEQTTYTEVRLDGN